MIFCFCISMVSNAQQGINYKAVIKDNMGNVVADQNIGLQFNIIQGSVTGGTTVYSENHNVSTNTDGLVVVTIGNGTPSLGVFSDIDWGLDDHFLNVIYDDLSGGSPVDLGTVQFNTVPYALEAENVTGLEAIDEGSGIGWRLVGKNPDNYGNVGLGAVDLSSWNGPSDGLGATGNYSTAIGFFTSSSGNNSLATNGGEASESWAVAMGFGAKALAPYSYAFGMTRAESLSSAVFGRYNIGGGDAFNWIETDPLFEIGNGTDNLDRANALTVLKNGTIIAPSFDLAEITDPKALITKEYADANAASGLEAIDEGNGIGWRLKGRNPENYGNIGLDAIDLSVFPSPNGSLGATGDYSTAIGYASKSSGDYSFAINFAQALGDYAIAMGSGAQALGLYSIAFNFTKAESYLSTALGRNNIGGGDPNNWVNTDPLFEIGNGFDAGNTNNALTILKNGEHNINSSAVGLNISSGNGFNGIQLVSPGATGIQIDDAFYHGIQIDNVNSNGVDIDNPGISGVNVTNPIVDGINASGAGRHGGYFSGDTSGVHAESAIDTNPDIILGGTSGGTATDDDGVISSDPLYSGSDIFLRSYDAVSLFLDYDNNETGQFEIKAGDGTEIFEVDESGTIRQNGATIHASDRRLKKNITPLSYGLKEVLQLNPKSYRWKANEQPDKSLGLIAQDVQSVISEIVSVSDDEVQTLGISYTELIPVLINALKEQQQTIETLTTRIETLETKNE